MFLETKIKDASIKIKVVKYKPYTVNFELEMQYEFIVYLLPHSLRLWTE